MSETINDVMNKVKVIYNSIIPFKGYLAINLFGIIFIRKEYRQKLQDDPHKYCVMMNHELIHTAQMKELWYIGFYLLYLWYYLTLSAKTDNAYRKIPFEAEAYKHEEDFHYLCDRKKFAYKDYKYGED